LCHRNRKQVTLPADIDFSRGPTMPRNPEEQLARLNKEASGKER
jgi:hypothetical protein